MVVKTRGKEGGGVVIVENRLTKYKLILSKTKLENDQVRKLDV